MLYILSKYRWILRAECSKTSIFYEISHSLTQWCHALVAVVPKQLLRHLMGAATAVGGTSGEGDVQWTSSLRYFARADKRLRVSPCCLTGRIGPGGRGHPCSAPPPPISIPSPLAPAGLAPSQCCWSIACPYRQCWGTVLIGAAHVHGTYSPGAVNMLYSMFTTPRLYGSRLLFVDVFVDIYS